VEMPFDGAFQTTILGRFIRFASRGKLLKYPDELALPESYRPTFEGGEKRGRWRSPSNAEKRWRGSSRMRTQSQDISKSRRHGDGIDRSSSDDTVVEGRDEEDVTPQDAEPSREGRGSDQGEERHPHLVDWYSETDQENPYVPFPPYWQTRDWLTPAVKTGQHLTKHSLRFKWPYLHSQSMSDQQSTQPAYLVLIP